MSRTTPEAAMVKQCMNPNTDAVISVPRSCITDRLVEALSCSDAFAAIIDVEPLDGKESLLTAIGHQCGFTWYSMNWDALIDWLCDFSWMPPKRAYVLALRQPETLPDEVLCKLRQCVVFCAKIWLDLEQVPMKLLLGREDEEGCERQ